MVIQLSSVAVGDAITVDPAAIRYRVSPIADLDGVIDGDWDRERIHPIERTVKHRAVMEHFRDGKPWEETELFTNIYRRRFKDGGLVRGVATIEELAAQYYERVDGMAESMRRDGFLTHREDGEPHPLPGFLIGRDGEVFIGNQGNHRLAIAQAIGLKQIAGRVVCKHKHSPR